MAANNLFDDDAFAATQIPPGGTSAGMPILKGIFIDGDTYTDLTRKPKISTTVLFYSLPDKVL
jgi:hypothetical protein